MSTVHLHLGSNIGERKFHIARTLQMIEVEVGPVTSSSAIYETEAWGIPQDNFLNLAITVEYYGSPSKLLATIQDIEVKLGRIKKEMWTSRIIDIDILIYEDIVMDTPELTIPHKEMAGRNFVLFPMAEIAPDLIHPVYKKTMQELLDECEDEAYVTVLNPEYV